ncbi:bifunctional glutamate N-acetyltransferase/amino-acid acetyltransferase ArgJ [Pelagibacteraceae bacterium]|nr:bifunctional glutamate N-acetyltransferase/amino-acid acetyltransferase ArgJ [Pelagibacteraceae bacterium]
MKKTIKKPKHQMINNISPLAPKSFKTMRPIPGVNIYTYCANLYNYNRLDVLLFLFEEELNIAEVFTKSKTRSITLDWNEKNLKKGKVKALLVNSGNANTFTGKQGKDALNSLAHFIEDKFHINLNKIFVASTGVIGEPFPYKKIIESISHHNKKNKSNFLDAAKTIMTTDTFPKLKEAKASIGGKKVIIKGIAKGSGMIAPNMATMLSFIFTDANISRPVLQALLKEINEDSFNSITVDSDESTNDTVMLISTNYAKHKIIKDKNDKMLENFKTQLRIVMINLAEQIVKDGEGASKLIEVKVIGANSAKSAKVIARSIAESPLVKTAIYGEDPNWGRIIMAIGKSKETINIGKLKIKLGTKLVASQGMRNIKYKESELKKYMKSNRINIEVDLGIGNSEAKMMTCDYSYDYIRINASYKS